MKLIIPILTLVLVLAALKAPASENCDQKTRNYLMQIIMSDYAKIQEEQAQVQRLEKALSNNPNTNAGQMEVMLIKRNIARKKAETAKKHAQLSNCISEINKREAAADKNNSSASLISPSQQSEISPTAQKSSPTEAAK